MCVCVGAVVGTILGLVTIISIGVYCYWRHDPKEAEEKRRRKQWAEERQDDEFLMLDSHKEQVRSSIGARYADSHDNKAFCRDDDHKQDMVANEYVMHPGMTRNHGDTSANKRGSKELKLMVGPNGRGSGCEDKVAYHQKAHANMAYEQRQRQSNLAGMGALSHLSSHDLTEQQLAVAKVSTAPVSHTAPQQVSGQPPQKPTLDRWEINRNLLRIQDKLGEGSFGEVWRAEGHALQGVSTVAVKALKGNN